MLSVIKTFRTGLRHPVYNSSCCFCFLLQIRNVLDNMDASDDCTRVVVVGGGYAGVELAAVVAEKIAKKSGVVTLVTDLNQILVMSPDLQRESAMEVLNEAGVEVRTGD